VVARAGQRKEGSVATSNGMAGRFSCVAFRKIGAKLTKTAVNTTEPLILNIEAATSVCSVCLSRGSEVLSLHESSGQNEHSRVITLLIERCMTDAGLKLTDLDAVAVSEGPGSYTSLRVGFSTAKGLCFALGTPLITINTLASLASAAFEEVKDSSVLYCAMIDARRMEVYAALFDADGKELSPPTPMIVDSSSFEEYFSEGQKIVFCGNGAEKCKMALTSALALFSSVVNNNSTYLVKGSLMAFSHKIFAHTAYAVPHYLKPPNITSARQFPL
jgi:tRNA threonylcarbamoyladenosine biosynthesis protein TsaB